MSTCDMATINRVQVIWTGSGITGTGLSTFYFDDVLGTPQQQATAVETFLLATDSQRATGCVWTISPDVAKLDTGTGQLVSIASTTGATAGGTAAGDRLPNSSQGLLRLFTAGVVGGRLLRGRLFLPGPIEGSSSNALPIGAYTTAYNNAAAALVASANAQWIIWSRTHAFTAAVTAATTWGQWAVLRSRRD